MSFAGLVVVFVGLSLAVLAATALARRVRPRHLAAIALSLVVLGVLTAVFDNVMIAAGLFDYGHERLAGVYVGRAPVEDFAYPLGAALLLPALWLLLTGRGGDGGDRGSGPGDGR